LGAAAQVPPETDRDGDGDEHGQGDHGEREERADPVGAFRCGTFHLVPAAAHRGRNDRHGGGEGGRTGTLKRWWTTAGPGRGRTARTRRRAARARPPGPDAPARAALAACTGA